MSRKQLTTERVLETYGLEIGDEVWVELNGTGYVFKLKEIKSNAVVDGAIVGLVDYIISRAETDLPISFLIGRNYFALPRCKPVAKYVLTEDEQAVIRNLPSAFTWIARDEVNTLNIFDCKPDKLEYEWGFKSCKYSKENLPTRKLFGFITWEDAEPVSIAQLRKCL